MYMHVSLYVVSSAVTFSVSLFSGAASQVRESGSVESCCLACRKDLHLVVRLRLVMTQTRRVSKSTTREDLAELPAGPLAADNLSMGVYPSADQRRAAAAATADEVAQLVAGMDAGGPCDELLAVAKPHLRDILFRLPKLVRASELKNKTALYKVASWIGGLLPPR